MSSKAPKKAEDKTEDLDSKVAPKAPKKAEPKPVPKGQKRVKALANMNLKDGSVLRVGEECLIGDEEYARLQKDKRGPFWEE